MTNPKTDPNNYGRRSDDEERDLGAKGGPVSGLGSADDKHSSSHPYNEDTQTQIAAKGKNKKKKENDKKNS